MRIFHGFIIFYGKIIVPSLFLSLVLGLTGNFLFGSSLLKGASIAYLFGSLLIHYLIYELGRSNEYYFYYNMGLSKLVLWGFTLTIGFVINVIIIL